MDGKNEDEGHQIHSEKDKQAWKQNLYQNQDLLVWGKDGEANVYL
jgi:hypothetical protein